jgi:uncharacterized membrane-anchored protein YjiN (DUF445 family)
MNDELKKKQLRNHKLLATGLFLLMAVIFITTTILEKRNPAHWIGYIRAFSEAAMVGALADWFAVTALFHHPLGLKIPHTNLIEKSKEKIGDNLGVLWFLIFFRLKISDLIFKNSKFQIFWEIGFKRRKILKLWSIIYPKLFLISSIN